MRGHNPSYPLSILKQNVALVQQQLKKLRSTEGDPLEWDWSHPYSIHQWQEFCPLYFEGLLQTTLGAPMHISHGGLQHASVRYYDAEFKRPGLPEEVAALVEAVSETGVTVTLVNCSTERDRKVIVQAGSFGEHQFTGYETIQQDGTMVLKREVYTKWLTVELSPGCGTTLKLQLIRYANRPTYETPWFSRNECSKDDKNSPPMLLRGRTLS
jgi:hypothetical protein